MIKATLIGISFVLLFFAYSLYQGDFLGYLIRFTGYTGFGLVGLAILMLGSTLGVDRIKIETPDVKRNFIVDDDNEEMKKERKLEQQWAICTLLVGLPSLITCLVLYFGS
ncbi:hypothetical protein NDK47_00840 [Brevibacillus ruminantium]|uniref:DUF3899 domain-containing protein n=1 Tax=Brevibacillus ruminantium TaxID=2950604 RepID=A0ABY4WMT2_9BACL|nr:hypothetical protein [Brevibacillus ruminantium]USG65936.1 hypothetical protein NDK47_00840 [Brevibacillus ruminantium]